MQTLLEKPKETFTSERTIIAAIFLAGFILRLRQYLTGRSLWLDEAMLALNIVNRNFIDLFKPLDYDQGAPIGFLLVEKVSSLIFGRNEYALRIFPFILGVLSLYFFYLLIKQYIQSAGLVIALALFALNPSAIYYSSEAKQYIADIFTSIYLLLLATQSVKAETHNRLWRLTIAGCIALWLSHPSLFILAGIGTSLFISHIQKRDIANTIHIAIMGIAWLTNTGILYILTLKNLQGNSFMREYWQGAFAPTIPWSNWMWYWNNFRSNADSYFAIIHIPWLLLSILLTGLYILYKQDKTIALILIWSCVFSLLASSLAIYPSLGRLGLYLLPVAILLIGISLNHVNHFPSNHRPYLLLTTIAFCGYLFWGSLPITIEQFLTPKYFEHIRPYMKHLQRSLQDGDVIYISYGGIPSFEFYAPIYGLEDITFISGSRNDYENPPSMLEKIEPLKGRHRVWVLFSHVYEKGTFNEKNYLLEYLKKNGDKKSEYNEPGTSVYLYLFDLGK